MECSQKAKALCNSLSEAEFFFTVVLSGSHPPRRAQRTTKAYRRHLSLRGRTQNEMGREDGRTEHKCDLVVLFMNWKIRLRLQKAISVGGFCFDANGLTRDEPAHSHAAVAIRRVHSVITSQSCCCVFFRSFLIRYSRSSYLKIRWNNECTASAALTLHILLLFDSARSSF